MRSTLLLCCAVLVFGHLLVASPANARALDFERADVQAFIERATSPMYARATLCS